MVVLAMVSLPLLTVGFLSGLRKKSEAKPSQWLAIRQPSKRASSDLLDAVQKG
jgi:hypothetical protein